MDSFDFGAIQSTNWPEAVPLPGTKHHINRFRDYVLNIEPEAAATGLRFQRPSAFSGGRVEMAHFPRIVAVPLFSSVVSEIQAATTSAPPRAQGGMTPTF